MDHPSRMRVTLLDGFELLHPSVAVPSAAGELPRAVQRLVAHLCLSPRTTRTATAGHLWPDAPEDHAHGSLRSALWRLNKAAPGLVEASGTCLQLAGDVRVDVRDLSAWSRRVVSVEDPDDVALPDTSLLGDLLPGWYDDWVLVERERLRQLRLQALEAVADRLLSRGRHGEALQAALAAVTAEPLRESAHRLVVRTHLAQGNVAQAVRAYELFRTMLRDELGVSPSETMSRLVQHVPRVRRTLPDHRPECRADGDRVAAGDVRRRRTVRGRAPTR